MHTPLLLVFPILDMGTTILEFAAIDLAYGPNYLRLV